MPRIRPFAATATALTALALPAAAGAAPINVTTTADQVGSPGCSLREAITAADGDNTGEGGDCAAGSGADTINLPAGTYTLDRPGTPGNSSPSSGDLDVNGDVTIVGAGAASTIVDGHAADRVFDFLGGTSELRDLTVRNGKTPDGPPGAPGVNDQGSDSVGADATSVAATSDGGGIRMVGTLTLNRVVVTDNHAGDGGQGGIAQTASAGAGSDGHASIGGEGGDGGHGGGIANENGHLDVVDSRITSNTAGDGGKGGDAGQGGKGADPNFSGGNSIGGLGGDGGSGGGIFESNDCCGGHVSLTRTLVSGNSAGDGGAGGAGGSGGNGGDSSDANTSGAGGVSSGADGGFAGSGGGVALDSSDEVALTDATIQSNAAGAGGAGGSGGAGGNSGSNSANAGNRSGGGSSSGGGGRVGGVGGGVSLSGQHPAIQRSTFTSNSAGKGGNGGDAGTGGTGQVAGDTTGGAAGEGGDGGGLSIDGLRVENLSNSTFASNTGGDGGDGGGAGTGSGPQTAGAGAPGGGGGGIYSSTSFEDIVGTHLTIAANSAGTPGSGASNGGRAGGIWNDSFLGKKFTLQNTIVASNTGPQCQTTQTGGIPDGPHNLVFPSESSCGAAGGGDPRLSALAPHGGFAPTMTLLAGSAAINAAGTGAPCTATDQRGVDRPKGSACDIGAVERSLPAAATAGANLIRAQQASVAGTVNPGQLPASYFFRYGKTKAYGSKTPAAGAGTGDANVLALATLRKLAPNTTYHYQLVGRNPDGTVTGVDRSFRTKPLPFAGVRILSKQATVENGRAPVKVRCPLPSSLTRCAGSLALTTRVKKHGKTTTVKLGTTSFTIASGKTATVKVKLTDAALKLVKAKGKLATEATARATDARGGKQKVTKRGVTLNAPTKG